MKTLEDLEDGFASFYQQVHAAQQPQPNVGASEAGDSQDGDAELYPYPWQLRLLREIVERGCWPDRISAPTGAGKTSVIDIHVYLNALAGESLTDPDYSPDLAKRLNALPRRLALLAPRRGLVDDQSDVSARIQEVVEAAASPVTERVREGLLQRAGADVLQEGLRPPALLVDTVRGGQIRRRFLDDDAWQTHPSYCALIHMTPEMFGSALLFRHYGAGVKRRPQDAGLLAIDTVAVVDEGHLQRQLLLTAQRVAHLDGLAPEGSGRPALEVVATTATPDRSISDQHVVEVEEQDLVADSELSRRLLATKTVELVDLDSSLQRAAGTKEVVQLLVELGKQAEQASKRNVASNGRVPAVGFAANTVRTALSVATELRNALGDSGERSVFSVVGRMRPVDRMLDLQRWPGVLTPQGNPDVRFIVSTQVLEVGVDLDLFALVTELASPTALAQRAGRVNRRGLWEGSRVLVIDGAAGKVGPYTETELEQGREWLTSLGGDISPWAVHAHPAPQSELRRRALQRLEIWDAEFFSASSERLVAERGGSGVELWTKDAFDEGLDVSLLVRGLPPDDAMAAEVMELMPPEQLEVLPVSVSLARKALARYLESDSTPNTFRRFFIWDPVSKRAELRRPTATAVEESLRGLVPGSTVVIDNSAAMFTDGVLVEVGSERLRDRWFESQQMRSQSLGLEGVTRPVLAQRNRPGGLESWQEPYTILSETQSDQVIKVFAGDAEPHATGEQREDEGIDTSETVQAQLREVLETAGEGGVSSATPTYEAVMDDVAEPNQAIIVATASRWDGSESVYEVRSRKSVLLADHSRQVQTRARSLGKVQRLPEPFVDVLGLAGLFHDRGKEDLRFQAVLRLQKTLAPDAEPLAKSRRRSKREEKQIRSMYNLGGWRHEQLSAAFAEAELPDMCHRDLTVRLVGTSHGWGRNSFADNADGLLHELSGINPVVEGQARALYNRGLWESLVERTNRRYGPWTAAYLEALLRAADVTVSAEGDL